MAQLKSTNIMGQLAVTGDVIASKFIKLNESDASDKLLKADGETYNISNIDNLETAVSNAAAAADTAQTTANNAQISAEQKTTMDDVQEWVQAGNYTISDNITIKSITLNNTDTPHIKMQRSTHNYLQASKDGATIALCANSTLSLNNSALVVSSSNVRPGKTNTFDLGTSSTYWKDIYASGKLTTGTIQLANTQNGTSTYDKIIMASDEGLLGYRTKKEFIQDLSLSLVYNYKGTKLTLNELKAITSADVGDVYFVLETGDNWACHTAVTTATGDNYQNYWSNLGKNVDLSGYVTLDTNQTITGQKTFTSGMKVSGRYQNSGDDEGLVIGRASNSYAGLCLGDPSGIRSVFYLRPNNSASWRHNPAGTSSYDLYHSDINGTIIAIPDTKTGTVNTLPKFTGQYQIESSKITDTGSLITLGSNTIISGLLNITNSNNTVTIGSQNASFCHIYNSTNIPFIFNKAVASIEGDLGLDGYPWQNIKFNGALQFFENTTQRAQFQYNTSDKCIDVIFT